MPATTTDAAVALPLWLQLHDSAFPAGRMVHSQGLEEWLAARPDAGPDEIGEVVLDFLAHSVAPLDATITAAAWRAADAQDVLVELDELTASYKLFGNARTASESAGLQLATAAVTTELVRRCRYLDAVIAGHTPGHCAVVDGVVQARLGIPQHTAIVGSLRSMMASMLSAAVRLGRLGPLHSQRLQARSAARVVTLAHESCLRDVHELHSAAPALEISGMRHETRTGRLFAT